MTVGEETIVGAGGEYSDFQQLKHIFTDLMDNELVADDGCTLRTASIHSYLTRVMYQRRNKFNPLWNACLVGGFRKV